MFNLLKIVIPKIKSEWDYVAYSMGYDPGTVDAIENECNGKLDQCCKKLFKNWLTTNNGCTPKTWEKIIERIKAVDNLAAVAENISTELGNWLNHYSCNIQLAASLHELRWIAAYHVFTRVIHLYSSTQCYRTLVWSNLKLNDQVMATHYYVRL